MNLLPLWISWGVLVLIIAALAIYRSTLAGQENDTIHLAEGEAAAITDQQSLAKKLAAIDKWGKILTVVAVVAAVLLAIFQMYSLFTATKLYK